MKILVIGNGGREHALAWKAARSRHADMVYVAPGNAGTAREPGIVNVPVAATDVDALCAFALEQSIDLTIVGPEAPLVAGVVDRFSEAGLKCVGPRAAAARLEGSKAFTKAFLERHGIPTGSYGAFADLEPALEFIETHGAPVVVKADGLAAGKGVVVAFSVEEACEAARDMLTGGAFGDAGRTIVVEEYLAGEEASFIAMVDGSHILPLATSQDHKARDDGDTGPNTGGMGAYSPAPVVTDAMHRRIMTEVMEPTVRGLAADGTPYTGFLYAGLMIGADGTPRVLEFNCRFGDPETQPIMMRLLSDLPALCLAAVDGRLAEMSAEWDPRPSLGVVLAAGGYPGDYAKGLPITGLDADRGREDLKIFHAGTRLEGDTTVTDGGRVLCATALGADIAAAQAAAYELVAGIQWQDMYYRRDIGHPAIAPLASAT